MLCGFDQIRSGYVAILFVFRGSTATSSATGDDIAVPERFFQNSEPAGRKKERTRKRPGFFPAVDLFDAI